MYDSHYKVMYFPRWHKASCLRDGDKLFSMKAGIEVLHIHNLYEHSSSQR
jgi:hypothetical protein